MITADVEIDREGWGESTAPDLAGLGPEIRFALAEEWAADALAEHASIAMFSRFSLQLLALGAPSDLVAGAQRAALDEVRHAKLCFALASAYRGQELGPSALPLGGEVELSADPAAVAAATVRRGCIGDAIAASLAAEACARAHDPAVKGVLALIAEDEARHAELAWRAVGWLLEEGGDRVRIAVERAFAEASIARRSPPVGQPKNSAAMAHGRLDGATAAEVIARTFEEVITPNAALVTAGAETVEDDQDDGPITRRSASAEIAPARKSAKRFGL